MGIVGIFGGTFNPIHYGHLILASLAYEEFKLDKVIFIPNRQPPHRPTDDLAEPELRYEMVKLAIRDDPRFEVSDIELRRPEPSYTYYTLTELVRTYPKLAFICGKDAILRSRWYKLEAIMELLEYMIIANRVMPVTSVNGKLKLYTTGDELYTELRTHPIMSKYTHKVKLLRMPFIDISSTMIRYRLKNGLSVRYMLPESVIEFIENRKLYR